jgi:hypothetical protein
MFWPLFPRSRYSIPHKLEYYSSLEYPRLRFLRNKTSIDFPPPFFIGRAIVLLYYPHCARNVVTKHVADVDIHIKTSLFPTMSASNPTCSVHANVPFVLLSTPRDPVVGTDVIFTDPDNFNYDVPPYRLTAADIVPTPRHPLLTVLPEERGLSTICIPAQSWPSLYFLTHPAIYRLLPFIQVPERINRTNPMYLATILDRAVPIFVSLL